MELEKQYCIYCKRELPLNKRRKNQWHGKCHQSIYGNTSSIIFQGEIVFKNDYVVLTSLEKEISEYASRYRLVKLANLIHMFENFGYVVSNKAVISLDLKFQVHTPFQKLKHLQTLHLTQFTVIDDSIAQLKKLRTLVIKHCNIKDLPVSIGKLTQLRVLEISGVTGLTQLPSAIGKLKKLHMLKLSPINEQVKIQALPESISKLTNLQYFYISGTNIKKLPIGFENLLNLQELYILSRSVIEIPNLQNFKKLRILQSQAKLSNLPDSFSELVDLEEVKLINNMLTEIPNVAKLQQLIKFEAINTKISHLPLGITKLRKLKSILVNQNPLSALPEDMSDITTLENLDTSQTNITNLPIKFLFPELKTLNLERTFITRLPEDIFLPKLESLKISCYFQGISKFLSLKQLYIINTLPGKELESFPDELFSLNNLQSLDIGKATFNSLPDKFDKLPKLRIFYLHNTMIRSMVEIPKKLQEKIYSKSMIIYVHPDFDFTGLNTLFGLRIKF